MKLSEYFLVACFGAVVFGFALHICGVSPAQIDDKWKRDVIARGYAQWTVSTNSLEPTIVFQWK